MIITRAPFRVSFFGGGSDLASFYNQSKGAVLSVAINKYMDQGVDFVKFGGTSHAFFPAMIGFSEARVAITR